MNKSRFYEILQAYKRGEDLSQFIPTNAPEAELIASLTGSTGGSSSGGKTYYNHQIGFTDEDGLSIIFNMINSKSESETTESVRTYLVNQKITPVVTGFGSGNITFDEYEEKLYLEYHDMPDDTFNFYRVKFTLVSEITDTVTEL